MAHGAWPSLDRCFILSFKMPRSWSRNRLYPSRSFLIPVSSSSRASAAGDLVGAMLLLFFFLLKGMLYVFECARPGRSEERAGRVIWGLHLSLFFVT